MKPAVKARSGDKPKPCAYVVIEENKKPRICGEPVPKHEWPADTRWPVLCAAHLRTYTPPGALLS